MPDFGRICELSYTMKTLDRLFSFLAERIVIEETQFSVHLYAHDLETQRLFSFLQFYMMSEKCIRICDNEVKGRSVSIRKLGKDELEKRWDEVWRMVNGIITHLQKSPVFYPGEEFTEEVYRAFLPECNVYVAEADGKMVGMIEANDEKPSFPFANTNAVNMGEIYLEPEYRGGGIAEALMHLPKRIRIAKQLGWSTERLTPMQEHSGTSTLNRMNI